MSLGSSEMTVFRTRLEQNLASKSKPNSGEKLEHYNWSFLLILESNSIIPFVIII